MFQRYALSSYALTCALSDTDLPVSARKRTPAMKIAVRRGWWESCKPMPEGVAQRIVKLSGLRGWGAFGDLLLAQTCRRVNWSGWLSCLAGRR